MPFITKVRPINNSNEYYFLKDSTAIRHIKIFYGDDEVSVPIEEGTATLQLEKYGQATDKDYGLIKVPENCSDGQKNNLSINNGNLTLSLPFDSIACGINNQSITPNTFMNKKQVVIPIATKEKYGVIKISDESSLRIEEGTLQVIFSGGYTNIAVEDENIDFDSLINQGTLSIAEG